MIPTILFDMIRYFRDDAKRINHAMKVYSFAHTICCSENIHGIKQDIIELAAILHDIGIKEAEKKYHSTAGNYQEIEGPPIARQILAMRGISPEVIDRVCYLIGNHHSYAKIDDSDFQILVEADFLVNIFEDDMPVKSIESIYKKYFQTGSGKEILTTMYLNNTSDSFGSTPLNPPASGGKR
ncbi:MAG: HD domain-containing protein [Candidatus Vecturithrix sp.]|nr:HD domain-containing protein [Candidatus Vecturithrix sp.]